MKSDNNFNIFYNMSWNREKKKNKRYDSKNGKYSSKHVRMKEKMLSTKQYK